MSAFTLKKHNTHLELALDGEYQINIDNFELKNCRPLLICDSKEYPLDTWKEISSDAKKILLETTNELGTWFLEFKAAGKNGISIRLYGELLSVQKDLQLIVMDLPLLKADHLLGQGAKMGSCACKLLKNVKKQDFGSNYQLMLTKDDSTLQLAFPLRQSQPNEFNGIIENGQVQKLQAWED